MNMLKVENLKKINLSFEAGTSPDRMDLKPKHPEFTFIFGLAPEGMSAFEYELLDKSEGQRVVVQLNREMVDRFFDHLNPRIWELFDGREDVYLSATIRSISEPDNREIVKAMATMAAHGGGTCDCGCS
jgi:hypothetical protein